MRTEKKERSKNTEAGRFSACISEMLSEPGLWTRLGREFIANVEATKQMIVDGAERDERITKFKTVAGIITEMYRSSINKRARIMACGALVRLDALSLSRFGCRAANLFRLEDILEQDRRDRGIKESRRQQIEYGSQIDV